MPAAESLNRDQPGSVAAIQTTLKSLPFLRYPSFELRAADLPDKLVSSSPLVGIIVASVNNHQHVGPESLRPIQQEWFYVVTLQGVGWYEPYEMFEDR